MSSPGGRTGAAGETARFARWCAARRVPSLPAAPATVLAYLEAAQPTGRTAARWVAAISAVHEAGEFQDPCAGPVAAWVRCRRSGKAAAGEGYSPGWLAGLLPEASWPCGLFGRRDRLAYLLSALGAIPAVALVELPATALTVTGTSLGSPEMINRYARHSPGLFRKL